MDREIGRETDRQEEERQSNGGKTERRIEIERDRER